MRRFWLLCALIVAGSTASCFSVDFTGLNFQCDPTQPGGAVCPDGYQCNSSTKLCVSMGTSAMDMGMTTTMDMATTSGSLVSTNACPSGMGYDITLPGKSKVYACPATFNNMSGSTADVQCKNGYMLCQSTTNVDLTACAKVGMATGGFFISSVEAKHDNQGENVCGTPSSGHPYPMWAGCGRMLTTTIAQGGNCSGFTEVLDCPATGTFSCAGNLQSARIGDAINTDARNGVLCCGP
jgi:hypothetical protein